MSGCEIELIGGPLCGTRLMVPANGSGSPVMYRIRLPLTPSIDAIVFPVVSDASMLLMRTAVYDRGEALSDETHRWPYIYMGMQA